MSGNGKEPALRAQWGEGKAGARELGLKALPLAAHAACSPLRPSPVGDR